MTDDLHSNAPQQSANANPVWERDLISKIAQAAVTEQRRARRWGIFFKLLFFAYIVVASGLFFYALNGVGGVGDVGRHTAVVSAEGVIASGRDASAGNIVTGLRNAFKADDVAGVILRINSPGGSPVQSGLIYDEIMRLRKANPDIPFYAVVADVCASGGYYIASAADKIYADKASIIGSIGVRADSFGAVDLMQKVGVERRLYTAGESKGMLDPFLPEQPAEVAHMESLLGVVHRQFIDAVRTGRGDRLADDPAIFSGLVWTGEQGMDLGLIDGLGGIRHVAEVLIEAEELVDYTPRAGWLERLVGRFGVSISQTVSDALGLHAGFRW